MVRSTGRRIQIRQMHLYEKKKANIIEFLQWGEKRGNKIAHPNQNEKEFPEGKSVKQVIKSKQKT